MSKEKRQKPNMTKMVTGTKEKPLLTWVKYNLIGGSIGIVCGILLSLFVVEPIKYSLRPDWLYHYHLEPLLSGMFFWLPLGLCIGVAQLWKLKQWKIHANGWIFATTSGWGVLGIILAYDDYVMRIRNSPSWHVFIIEAITLLLGGMCIGIFQSITTRNVFRKSGLWIMTNMLGMLALIEVTWGMISLPFVLKSYILNFFYAHGLDVLIGARDLLVLGYITISLPFVATLTLFIPTGKVLLKYRVQYLEKDDRVNNKAN